jgi:hypothetical protein
LVQLLQDVCLRCIKNLHCTFNTRKTASDTLKKLIKFFQNYEMELHEIIQEYNGIYSTSFHLFSTSQSILSQLILLLLDIAIPYF